uniref:Ycf34 n=1 Tax=Polysiphonia scopulorum TaxID=257860 RepID=A0A1Z1MHK1_9FLOR|nr:hypothetical protein [Polysiphonia scopulorum]ARW65560.1 hypothetical protein [Polysiphonia scopulorum]
MCICINCRHIHNCKTYHFIDKQHNHLKICSEEYKFSPLKTILNVNINKKNKQVIFDWDLKECSSFTEEPGYWLFNE